MYNILISTGFWDKNHFSHQFYSQTLPETRTAVVNLQMGKLRPRFKNLSESQWQHRKQSLTGSPACFAATGQELIRRSAAKCQRWCIHVMLTWHCAEPPACTGCLSKHCCFVPCGWRTWVCAGE